jgi:hypothetical protein
MAASPLCIDALGIIYMALFLQTHDSECVPEHFHESRYWPKEFMLKYHRVQENVRFTGARKCFSIREDNASQLEIPL